MTIGPNDVTVSLFGLIVQVIFIIITILIVLDFLGHRGPHTHPNDKLSQMKKTGSRRSFSASAR